MSAPLWAGLDCVLSSRPPACTSIRHSQTAAFALPILERLGEDPYGIFAVVLTAGRELAQQIADTFIALGAGMTLRVAVVTGGADTMAQAKEVHDLPSPLYLPVFTLDPETYCACSCLACPTS